MFEPKFWFHLRDFIVEDVFLRGQALWQDLDVDDGGI